MGDTPTDFASDLPVLERIETLIVLCSDKYYEAGRRREIGLGGHDDAIVEGDSKRKEAILLIERELTAANAKVAALEVERKEMEAATLPCDVLVAPATIIHSGVPLSTLHTALARRVGLDPRPTFSDLRELARSTNYWANDAEKPTEVTFSNGRVVRIVDGILEVSWAQQPGEQTA